MYVHCLVSVRLMYEYIYNICTLNQILFQETLGIEISKQDESEKWL